MAQLGNEIGSGTEWRSLSAGAFATRAKKPAQGHTR